MKEEMTLSNSVSFLPENLRVVEFTSITSKASTKEKERIEGIIECWKKGSKKDSRKFHFEMLLDTDQRDRYLTFFSLSQDQTPLFKLNTKVTSEFLDTLDERVKFLATWIPVMCENLKPKIN